MYSKIYVSPLVPTVAVFDGVMKLLLSVLCCSHCVRVSCLVLILCVRFSLATISLMKKGLLAFMHGSRKFCRMVSISASTTILFDEGVRGSKYH